MALTSKIDIIYRAFFPNLFMRKLATYITRNRVKSNEKVVLNKCYNRASNNLPNLPKKHNQFNHVAIENVQKLLVAKYNTSCNESSEENLCRHLYHEDVESLVNTQIFEELTASYAYLSLANYFGRTEIALPGCQGFFIEMHREELEHAMVFINYQLMRGGHVMLCPILPPKCENWEGIVNAFRQSVLMERSVKEKITALLRLAEKYCDDQLVDFLVSQYLKEQNYSIAKLARLLTRAKKMVKDPNGEFLFDKLLFENYVEKKNPMFERSLPDEDDTTYK